MIIATRDRPELLSRALHSVSVQHCQDLELILVDDSSNDTARRQNATLLADLIPTGRLIDMPTRPGGSGPGAARNLAMAQATRPFLAFLDDDDEWVDPDYLLRTADILDRLKLDLHFADQQAIRADGSVVPGPVWAEDLAGKLPASGVVDRDGTFILSPEQILLSDGFAHLNTTAIRRDLARDRLGGFDETLRYEEDRDFFLRAVDVAETIGYTPVLVARHHVPSARPSASSIATAQKQACRLAVMDKAVGTVRHEALRDRCRRDRAYTLKAMSVREAADGDFGAAIGHGRGALRDQFGMKWAAFVASLYLRSAISRRSHAG